MFQPTKRELDDWRSQFVMSNPGVKRGLRRAPYAFTEGRDVTRDRVEMRGERVFPRPEVVEPVRAELAQTLGGCGGVTCR
jgi:hypothetical protein